MLLSRGIPCGTATWISTHGDVRLLSAVIHRLPGTSGGSVLQHSRLYSVLKGRLGGRNPWRLPREAVARCLGPAPPRFTRVFTGGAGAAAGGGAGPRSAPLRSAPFWGEVTAQDFSVGTEQKRKHAPAVEVGCAWSSKPAGGIWCQGVWRLVWRSGHRVFLSAFVPSILAAAPSHVFNLMHFSHACGW